MLGKLAHLLRRIGVVGLVPFLLLGSGAAWGQEQVCGTKTWNLTAGQTIVVGTVTASNDSSNLYVTYTLDPILQPNATLGNLHMWVGDDLLNVPSTPGGIPIPGAFPYKFDATGLTTHTFVVPLDSIGVIVNPGQDICVAPETLYIVTHAEVNGVCASESCEETSDETAWGGDNPGSGPRWWFYGEYTICCNPENPPPPLPVCTTAYGYGTHVWTTDKKSNPQKLPSLNLTKNRWGWAYNMKVPGSTTQNLYAGAGLNNIGNGYLVGSVTLSWDGAAYTVTYNMLPGYWLNEVHVYAGDTPPTTIAPGQYGNIADFDAMDMVTTYSFSGPLSDLNGDGVWFVEHGVSCYDSARP